MSTRQRMELVKGLRVGHGPKKIRIEHLLQEILTSESKDSESYRSSATKEGQLQRVGQAAPSSSRCEMSRRCNPLSCLVPSRQPHNKASKADAGDLL